MTRSVPPSSDLQLLGRWIFVGAVATGGACAIYLTSRSFTTVWRPLPGLALVMVGVFLAASIIATYWLSLWATSAPRRRGGLLAGVSLAAALLAWSLTDVRASPAPQILLWLLVLGSIAACAPQLDWEHPAPEAASASATAAAPDENTAAASVQLVRRPIPGGEELTCVAGIEFAPGQQSETWHIAFCPPLERQPTARLEHDPALACEVKLAELACYGARVELKRRGSLALPLRTTVKLIATARAAAE